MEKYTIISCIFDVASRNPAGTKRTVHTYLSMFKYIQRSDIDVILFIDPYLVDQIEPRPGLTIIGMKLEDLPNYKFLSDLNGMGTLGNFTMGKEYSAVVSSKIYLMKCALEVSADKYDHYVWLDAGISHIGTLEYRQLRADLELHMHDKITLVQVNCINPKEMENLGDYLSKDRFKIAAGLMIVPKEEVLWFYDKLDTLYRNSITEFKRFINEEPIISVIKVMHPDKFRFLFSGFPMIRNLRYLTVETHVTINNMVACRRNNLNSTGYSILKYLLESMKHHQHSFNFEQICNILIEGQIISYYTDLELCKKLSMILIYLYRYNHNCRNILNRSVSMIKTNLRFLQLDLDKTEMNLKEMVESELLEYVWTVL